MVSVPSIFCILNFLLIRSAKDPAQFVAVVIQILIPFVVNNFLSFYSIILNLGKKNNTSFSKIQCFVFFKFWHFRQGILYIGFRATLNVRKFKVNLHLMYRICLNFAKSCISSCFKKKFCNKKKKNHNAVFEI